MAEQKQDLIKCEEGSVGAKVDEKISRNINCDFIGKKIIFITARCNKRDSWNLNVGNVDLKETENQNYVPVLAIQTIATTIPFNLNSCHF